MAIHRCAGPYYASDRLNSVHYDLTFVPIPRSTYSGSDSTTTDNNPIKASELLEKHQIQILIQLFQTLQKKI